ncbi:MULTISPECIES: hypothetical protein [Alphaproteobacteria]|nr:MULTISPECIES: hypothetical protein [Alphaproteobacteria]
MVSEVIFRRGEDEVEVGEHRQVVEDIRSGGDLALRAVLKELAR